MNIKMSVLNEEHVQTVATMTSRIINYLALTRTVLSTGGREFSLYPGAHDYTVESYEHMLGYALSHVFFQRGYRGEVPELNADLRDKSYLKDQVLTPERAAHYVDLIEAELRSAPSNDFVTCTKQFNSNPQLARELLEDCLNEQLDEQLRAFFKSYYMPISIGATRTLPAENVDCLGVPEMSYKWHCDAAPKNYLKILLYLNDADQHGGGTAFLDASTTRKLADIGYVHGDNRARQTDLSPLTSMYDIPCEPLNVYPKSGEGVLFQPVKVLHKGLIPTLGPRYTVQIGFVPIHAPWQETFDLFRTYLIKFTDVIFPMWQIQT